MLKHVWITTYRFLFTVKCNWINLVKCLNIHISIVLRISIINLRNRIALIRVLFSKHGWKCSYLWGILITNRYVFYPQVDDLEKGKILSEIHFNVEVWILILELVVSDDSFCTVTGDKLSTFHILHIFRKWWKSQGCWNDQENAEN